MQHNQEKIADIHILTPDIKSQFLAECIEFLPTAQINLSVLAATERTLGESRKYGYSVGNLSAVAYADYDDIYDSAVIISAIHTLQKTPEASMVYTNEEKLPRERTLYDAQKPYSLEQHKRHPAHVHGFKVYRRSVVESAPKIIWTFELTDWALTLWAGTQGTIIKLPSIGRSWRIHKNQYSKRITFVEIKEVQNWFANLSGGSINHAA